MKGKGDSRIKRRFGVFKKNVFPSWKNARSSGTVFKKELSFCTWSGKKE